MRLRKFSRVFQWLAVNQMHNCSADQNAPFSTCWSDGETSATFLATLTSLVCSKGVIYNVPPKPTAYEINIVKRHNMSPLQNCLSTGLNKVKN